MYRILKFHFINYKYNYVYIIYEYVIYKYQIIKIYIKNYTVPLRNKK